MEKQLSNSKIIIKDSEKPGPNVLIMAGVHGREVCGVKALDELIPKIVPRIGKITFIYANLEAIKQNKRFIEKNLNRCFLDSQPKELADSLEGKTAREIIPYLKEADILLDLHSSRSSNSQKYVICGENCFEFIDYLPASIVLSGVDGTHPHGSDDYMFNHGKKGMCLECGLHEAEDSVTTAKEAVLNLLKKLEMIPGTPNKYPQSNFFRSSYLYKNKFGEFILARKFIDFEPLKVGELIGTDGERKIFAEEGDYILFVDSKKELGLECFTIVKKVAKP